MGLKYIFRHAMAACCLLLVAALWAVPAPAQAAPAPEERKDSSDSLPGTAGMDGSIGSGANAAPVAEAGSTIYVDVDAMGANNGSSWADAYTGLEPALSAARTGDEIWVAEGVYKPGAEHGGSGGRYKSFQMKNGVAIYGGFDPTVGAIGFGDRDWVSHVTTLSGDIGIEGDRSDNCYHVFFHTPALGLNSTAILDGFQITGGTANLDMWPHGYGGGMHNYSSSPTVSNCTFVGNEAIRDGGGMSNYESSAPVLAGCTFHNNSAPYGAGMWNSTSSPTLTDCTFTDNSASYGAGMWNFLSSSPILTRCSFAGNDALLDGGGIYTENGSPTLTGCTFTDNSAVREGGGMFNDSASPTMTNCTFSGNSADEEGGGLYNRDASSPSLINCVFFGNSAGYYGGAMYNFNSASPELTNCTFSDNTADIGGGGIYNTGFSSPVLVNSILWGDSPDEIVNYDWSCTPVVTYSDVQGGYAGEGNLAIDPRFVDPDGGDLHLGACSRCIDRGNNSAPDLPSLDFEGDGRIVDGDGNGTPVVDMGADEAAAGSSCRRFYLPVILRQMQFGGVRGEPDGIRSM